MANIISVHSFRGGTGKSNMTANIAALLAADGYRVGVVDADVQSPGIHVLFGLKGDTIVHSLNDYLWERCDIQHTAINVTSILPQDGQEKGQLFLIPASIKSGEIARILRGGCDPRLLTNGFRQLITSLDLDILLIDTHPGLNEETMLSIALSSTLIIVMRPDQQDYEGTGVTIEVSQALEVPQTMILVNKVPSMFDLNDVKTKIHHTFHCPVAAVLPQSEDVMSLASGGVFVLHYPNHLITTELKAVATNLLQ